MPIKKYCAIFALFGLFGANAIASSRPNITVYTTHNYPIARAELAHRIYYLDEVEIWEEQISRSLSVNPNQAQQQATQFFTSPQWQQQEQGLKQAYEGVLSGWQNGIKKVPAIHFQTEGIEDSVIYGATNVDQALQLWQKRYAQQ